jgi:uncharacterized protein (DUF697 family)
MPKSSSMSADVNSATDTESAAAAGLGSQAQHFVTLTRDAEGDRIISKYVGWGAGSGSIPFPLFDVAAIGTVQVVMVRDLLALYEKSFSETRVRSVVAVLLGSLSPGTLAGATAITLLRVVPVFGTLLAGVTMPLLSSAATYAVGKAIQSHLAEGGDLLNLDTTKLRARVRNAYEEGKARTVAAKDALTGPAPVANT